VTAARCELTDLLVDQCGCPEHRDGRTVEEEATADRTLGPRFTAQYDGRCSRCGTDFWPGESIRGDGDGGWIAGCCP
jgi:hypothetical protein